VTGESYPSYRNSEARPDIMRGAPPALLVPRLDWDRPPWNRWAFQHIREILPTAEVWRGDGPPGAVASAPRELGQVAFTRTDGAVQTVDQLLEETYTDSFLVVHSGKIIAERYFNGMTARTLHLSQSMSKSVTAATAGVLIGRGLLDPKAPLTDYIPELASTAYSGATLQHVLDMTSGVTFNEEYTDRYSHVGQMDVASGWKPVPPGSDPAFRWPAHVFEQIMSLQMLEAEHGSRFLYRSIETDVLAFCMERATGKRLPELVGSEIWAPMGAEESANFTLDAAGYALASGGLSATLRDYARFGLVILNGGRLNGRQIVPPAWVADIRRGPHGLANDYLRASLPNGCYRNQFWIEDRAHETVMCRGVFGQLIYIAPEHDLVVVKLSSYPDFLNLTYGLDTRLAIGAINKALR
jgi:CubicO group peptidase (beta-lactamase class C family)